MTAHPIKCTVNGAMIERLVEPRLTAADFLRHELKLTGTHVGCEHGVCGACTVIVNGRAVRSCLMFAVQLDGKQAMTVEGLSSGETLSPLQEAFRRRHALQCGFCTSGMLMTAHAFLQEQPTPTVEQIRDVISGNICRCTGYVGIVEAIHDAAQTMREPP
jgi:carbon-monoxide dehydrogenase small subunit